MIGLAIDLGEYAEIVRLELLSSTYRYNLPEFDQSLTPVAECGIELVIRKRDDNEVIKGGKVRDKNIVIDDDIIANINQYSDDYNTLMENNKINPPFQNRRVKLK